MAVRAVTFDFHNTLARCDRWFALEVRDLVPAVLAWHAENTGAVYQHAELARAVDVYRALRLDIIHHGEEVDALDSTMHVIEALGLNIDREVANCGIHAVMRDTLIDSTAIPGVVEAVNTLTEHDIQLGVVSSAVFHPFLEWSLEKFGILDRFETVVTSASCGFYKSRTEIYQHTLDTLGVAPHETVHVGDSHRFDVRTARRLGMGTVWFRNQPRPGEGEPSEADITVDSLEGVASTILQRFVDAR